MRYLRAFWVALRYTLQGKTLQSPFAAWMQATADHLALIDKLAQQAAIDPETFTLVIDHRQTSMATILQSVEFNRREAYPRLLKERAADRMNYVYAANMGDHFRVSRLEAALPAGTPLNEAVAALAAHLEAIPRS